MKAPRTPRVGYLSWVVSGVALLSTFGVALWIVALVGEPGPALDDTYIHLQFARSLADGHGMAYRAGEWVSGSTAPLWTALLSIAFALGIDPVWWGLLLGMLFNAAAAREVCVLLAAYRSPLAVLLLGGLLFVFSDLMIWSALSGMEISLFVFLSTLGMRLHVERWRTDSWTPVALVLAIAALARPEGLLLLVLAGAERGGWILAHRRVGAATVRWRDLGSAAMVSATVLLPFALFGWSSSGDPLPTTFSVKTEASARGYPALRDLWRAAEVLFRSLPVSLWFAGAGTAWLIARWLDRRVARSNDVSAALGRAAAPSLIPLLWLFALPLAYSCLASADSPMPLGNFGRYVYPLAPALVVVGCLGLAPLFRALSARLESRTGELAGVALVTLILLPSLVGAWHGIGRLSRNVYDVQTGDVQMARWLHDHVSPEVTLAVQDIGAVGFMTGNPLFDLVGIVDPEVIPIVKQRGDGLETLRDLLYAARDAHAGLLVLFPESYGGVRALEAAVPGRWQVIHQIEVPGNITLAGSTLVAVVPPWARFEAPAGSDR